MASRWTPGALSHDFGGREKPWSSRAGRDEPPFTDPFGADTETACHWPARWSPIAVAILDLPVPVRDEPQAVSGEVGRG